MKDWRQSDVLWFILPESLRMLSVPHEGSDESRLSVRHLIISQKSLWCYPLTMAHSSLLTTVPTNNEELTAATNGDRVVPTVHLRVRQIKWKHRKLLVRYILVYPFLCGLRERGGNFTFEYQDCEMWRSKDKMQNRPAENTLYRAEEIPRHFDLLYFLHVDTNIMELMLPLNMHITMRLKI